MHRENRKSDILSGSEKTKFPRDTEYRYCRHHSGGNVFCLGFKKFFKQWNHEFKKKSCHDAKDQTADRRNTALVV